MSDAPLLSRRDGAILHLVLNRPAQGNALSNDMVEALDTALDVLDAQSTRALVLEGAGKHFCTGFDISHLERETDDSLLARFTRIELLLQRIARLSCSTIAVARGRAIGAGADLYAACAHRIVDGDASFAFPGARGFGLVLGSRRLAARVGALRAEDWVSSARRVDRDEALEAGLVTAVATATTPMDGLLQAACVKLAAPTDPLLRAALEGNAAADDASDLSLLVRSAARGGLHARVSAYVARMQPASSPRAVPPETEATATASPAR